MATVNGNPNWEMRLAPASSAIFTQGLIVSSNRGYRTLNRALSVKMEEASKTDENGQSCLDNKQEAEGEG